MNARATDALIKLSDTDETIANTDEDIRDRTVVDRDGDELGKVKDLLIDRAEGKVRILEVASGGFLGIGQDLVFIPVDAIAAISADEVRVDETRGRVADAPVYDPELIREPETYGGLFDYYGYEPFWGPGYLYPGYPYYPR
ncbi:PRC-barrel domain-containing protein [Microbacterium sp. G2-8]|uniref:PRC-barrel domain-containing protein n=1 Tax=Microbacterium sp. G2-8 TaxID=2842454 RepID=UPI001C8AA3C6|nr:PRC-barrel domain-containing protein [Microbacterium sp. G2-8]